MTTKSSFRWLSQALVLATLIAGSLLGNSSGAWAAESYGTPSISYFGVANPPTSDKPQSKLWWNDGSWWADMWKSGSGWHIHRLDRASKTWVDTGLRNDTRGTTLADTLWDGEHLYIASHVVTITGDGTPVPSQSGQPAKLYRYSYSGGTYTLDDGFPTTINNNSSETMTIDKDSTGAIWATWTQVTGSSSAGFTNTVYVNNSAPGGTGWETPFVIPVANPRAAPDDISAVVAFKNKIGVMWSDQLTGTVAWATRTDGTSPTSSASWNYQEAVKGKDRADDHFNLKTLQADSTGRVYAAVKTNLNHTSSDPTLAQLQLLVFKPGTGSFSTSTISTVGDCVTRPQIVLDSQNDLVHAFQTAPSTSVSGCAYSGVAGSIYQKTASMDNPVFASGRGTPVIENAASANMNNVSTSKQSVSSTTGLVVIASDHIAKRYWFADISLGSSPPEPEAAFTATPTTGTAPLPVSFTDTSTGAPTSWSWTFGDGGTSTEQNPSHTYTTAGTYTAELTATNAEGSTTATATITVSPAPPPAPVAAFTATPTTGTAPLPVSFTDTSTGAPTSWSWTFGDGGTSTEQNPTHTYDTAGTYTAELTATNAGGSTTTTTTITVNPPAPVAAFTATPTTGTAPLPVSFTDTSTGAPTSWSWTFGDGGTSTEQNPTHTYDAAATYTAELTVTNAGGSTTATSTITVNPAPGTVTAVGSTTTNSTRATTAVTLAKPPGTTAGDVLVASITADKNPTSSIPSGWNPIFNNLSNSLSIGSGARMFAYWHVVGSSDPASYTWTLSTAVKWGAGVTSYRGVNNTTPLDSTVATAVSTSNTATSITAPSITTASNGAMLIGGVGFDSGNPGATPPSGWTERWEAAKGQIAAQADITQATAGASGTHTWTFSTAKAAVWLTALKPAS